ncbi:MAG: 4-hydroxy-tetrahydrodipicolinate synthase [Clostridia bacterium]|nr:4-hydroxy-tetrahydrodipicolinate synthase [Clostridia bacterium]
MYKDRVFEGSCVALVTPFTDNKGVWGIDFDKMGQLIEDQIANKTDAILIAGTTGESSTMFCEEHMAAIEYAVKKVANRVPVIANAGSNETRRSVELTQFAKDLGADAVLSVTPYYNKTTQRGLFEHFKAIAGAADIPVIMYNVPSRTGMNISPETQIALSYVHGIAGVKECSVTQIPEVLCGAHKDYTVYSGEDGVAVAAVALGAKGVISVIANIAPQFTHDMMMASLEGNLPVATEMQLRCTPLVKALFCETNPIPVKEGMNLLGWDVGGCRLPLVDMEPKHVELLRKEMADFGLKVVR